MLAALHIVNVITRLYVRCEKLGSLQNRSGRALCIRHDQLDLLRQKWHFKSVWGRFAVADRDHTGSLTADEITPFMPSSTTELDRPKWLAMADRHGAHGVITIAPGALPPSLSQDHKGHGDTDYTRQQTE